MSISFQAVDGDTLDFNNGLATRLLTAIGYDVTEETAGSMSIEAAKKGIAEARSWQRIKKEDMKYFEMLEDLIDELADLEYRELVWS